MKKVGTETKKETKTATKIDFNEMQRVFNYKALRKSLVIPGIIGIVLGTVFLCLGIENVIMLLIGIFMIAMGIWLLVAPSRAGIIVAGISNILLAIIVILFALIQGQGKGYMVVVAIFQMMGGIQGLTRYSHLSKQPVRKPTSLAMRQADTLMAMVRRAKIKEDAFVIQFYAYGIHRQIYWKGKLYETAGVFLEDNGETVIIAPKQKVSIKE
jgi:hypothetical protein